MSLLARRPILFSLLVGLIIFLADRLHKYIQLDVYGWRGGEGVRVTPFFDYVLVWNPGVSYGLLTGLPPYVLVAIMVAAIALLIWWWIKSETALARYALAICIGGAASHIVDRIQYGAVADFFYFHWQNWSFYVFNISDSAITIGVILLIVDMFWPRKQRRARR